MQCMQPVTRQIQAEAHASAQILNYSSFKTRDSLVVAAFEKLLRSLFQPRALNREVEKKKTRYHDVSYIEMRMNDRESHLVTDESQLEMDRLI